MRNCFVLILITITLATSLTSCAVTMAARKSGTDINEIQGAVTRSQILSTGAEIVNSDRDTHGNLIETYRIQKEKGSTARAVMHGVLDLSTFFVWEAIGTPIEGYMNKKEYFSVRITFDKEERVKKIELV